MSSPSRRILLTGAAGEIGHGLARALADDPDVKVIAVDLRDPGKSIRKDIDELHMGDICDRGFVDHIVTMHEITEIVHLAALLSTRAEHVPEKAHEVNVDGTFNLLRIAAEQAQSFGRVVKFTVPSSIAVYGLSPQEKALGGKVGLDECLRPVTMYGANKLYCEALGRYYGRHYRSLTSDGPPPIDFRCLRLPGVLAAETKPTGGTSDFVPEMIHAAASGQPYECFVTADTRIPWMTMPECVEATLQLLQADSVAQCVYNVASFSASAGEVEAALKAHFPDLQVTYVPHEGRQAMVHTWPDDVDVSDAVRDWGYTPRWTLQQALEDYIVPAVRRQYAST
ncbi:MAG: NAD-dependent epimerase/dehydratase family protein [Phycisphaerales bacterium]|nr:NAD-dependent epimerase/dehydratase family protein [Phycisphaerales bacterium]